MKHPINGWSERKTAIRHWCKLQKLRSGISVWLETRSAAAWSRSTGEVGGQRTITFNFIQTVCRSNVHSASWHDSKLMLEPYYIAWLHHIRSGSKEKFPSTRQETCSSLVHSSNFQHMDIYFSEVEVGEAVVQGWRSLVTLHVPVCVRLHLRLSSHLTALSVSTADQNTSLSLTGWTDSAAIQTDSSSGSWWREGGRQESGGERLDKRGVKEHTNNKRSKLKSVNTLKSSTQHDSSYCCFPEFKKTPHLIIKWFCFVTEQLLPNITFKTSMKSPAILFSAAETRGASLSISE